MAKKSTDRINRPFFFNNLRTSLFRNKLAQAQVDGMNAILDAWEASHSDWDDRWLAYALGTTHLETNATMKPISEFGGAKYFNFMYGPEPGARNPKNAKAMGNTQPGDGARYCGRGYVQLTWKNNYAKMAQHLSTATKKVDLVGNPALALDPANAAEIMFFGMSTGAFSGRKLSDYFSRNAAGNIVKDDWVGARAIINGKDKATVIADLGHRYYASISY